MTVALVALCVTIAGLLYDRRQMSNERSRLVNAVIARDGRELMALNREPKAKKQKTEAEVIDFPVGIS